MSMDAEDRSILTRTAPSADAVIAYGPAPEQVADVRYGVAGDDRPRGVFVHGGFWRPRTDRTHTGPLCAALAADGWTTAAIEYRRVPGHPEMTVTDVQAALTSLPGLVTRHDGRVLVAGHSAGGHLALLAAATTSLPALVGVVALAPVADLERAERMGLGDGACQAFLGCAASTRTDLDPVSLPAPPVPTTIVHGATDAIVPLEISEAYVAAHPTTRLVITPTGGHFGVIDPLAPAWQSVVDALRSISAS
jgi:acetyl esterase/lipase